MARIDPIAQRLVYAGVGNVEARLWRDDALNRLIALRGIVGGTIPTIRTFEYALGDDWALLLHTDGISARFGGTDVDACIQTEPLDLVSLLLQHWSRPQDDATALVVRPR